MSRKYARGRSQYDVLIGSMKSFTPSRLFFSLCLCLSLSLSSLSFAFLFSLAHTTPFSPYFHLQNWKSILRVELFITAVFCQRFLDEFWRKVSVYFAEFCLTLELLSSHSPLAGELLNALRTRQISSIQNEQNDEWNLTRQKLEGFSPVFDPF